MEVTDRVFDVRVSNHEPWPYPEGTTDHWLFDALQMNRLNVSGNNGDHDKSYLVIFVVA